jgi:ABC-2 type transport system ATP-binding protein
MIEIHKLTKSFRDLIAVDHVSLTIPKGQICGYLGPNGAGKTTTIKLLGGMIKPTEGSANVAGYDVFKDPVEVKKRIGYVPESGAVYQSLTPYEYLKFIGRLYKMADTSIFKRIDEFAEFLQIKNVLHQRMSTFSKGMRQKVIITSALFHNPEVIFLDEPLNGLDSNSALLLKELLRNLSNQGITVFYSSHILEVVEQLCDRVVIIHQGKIVADGSVNALKEMTQKPSLEDVFSHITHAQDIKALAKAFSKTIAANHLK